MSFVLPDRYLSSLPTGSVKDVVDDLGRKIANHEFLEGEVIPKEDELCEMFGVSRTVIREAIKVLSGKGMVRTARRYGTRVCASEDWNLLDPDVILLHGPESPMAARIYAESTRLRLIVEPQAAELAAVNATDEQRATILKAANLISPEPHGNQAMMAADFAFHATILEATDNIMLSQLQGLILALLQFSYPTGAQTVPDEKVSKQNHIDVAQAIHDGQAREARERMYFMLSQNEVIAKKMENA